MGTPLIGFVYEEKIEGSLELAGISEYGLPQQDISFDTHDEKFLSL